MQNDVADRMEELQVAKTLADMDNRIKALQNDLENESQKRKPGGIIGGLRRAILGRTESDEARRRDRVMDELKAMLRDRDKIRDEFNRRQAMEAQARSFVLDGITKGTRSEVTTMRPIRFKTKSHSA